MAFSYIFLDTRAPRKDGSFPVKIAISHKTKVYINLKIYVTKEQFANGRVVNHPQKAYYNNLIKYKTSEIDNALIGLGINGKLNSMSALQVKVFVENDGKEVAQSMPAYTFQQALKDFLVMPKKSRTKEIYTATLNKVNEYAGTALSLSDINYAWLSKFGEYMEGQGLTVNAQALHYRNIRAVFNFAIDESKVSLNDYPFRRFKIKKQDTPKRSISVEALRKIRDTQWDDGRQNLQEAADFFMLSFYFIGMNIIDILHLKDLKDSKITYHRAKTGRLYEFGVPPAAMPILEKYKGQDYLLMWRERYTDYRGFTSTINERLKIIGNAIGVADLTTYHARHTWATIAADLEIPKETIAAALGHGEKTTTDIYIDFDRKKIDKANNLVINFVCSY